MSSAADAGDAHTHTGSLPELPRLENDCIIAVSAAREIDETDSNETAWIVACAERWAAKLSLENEVTDVPLRGQGKDHASNAVTVDETVDSINEADLHTIRVDILRTRADDAVFKTPQMRQRLESLLKDFSIREGIRYMQGLNEVAAVFAYIEQVVPDSKFCASTSSACFAAFVRKFIPCFYDGDGFVVLHVSLLFFRQLLLYHHPDLHNHLEHVGVSPIVYATPWFITLFASRTPLTILVRLWDKYLERGEASFMPFLAVAMIAMEKCAILAADEDDVNLAVGCSRVTTLAKLDSVWAAAEALHAQTPMSFPVRMSRVIGKVLERMPTHAKSKSWADQVLTRAEHERRLSMMPKEVVAHYVRAKQEECDVAAAMPSAHPSFSNDDKPRVVSKVIAANLLALRVMLLDVRPVEEFRAEHMPHALHFHPPCLRLLTTAYSKGSQPRAERFAAALAAAVASAGISVTTTTDLGDPAPEANGPWADRALISEIFDSLQERAAECWGDDWLSESGRAHLMLLGGEADWDSLDMPCKADAGGAVIPLFEMLAEHVSVPRVSVVLGGAVALHKEAVKRGVQLVRPDFASDTLGQHKSRSGPARFSDFLQSARKVADGAAKGIVEGAAVAQQQATQGAAVVKQQAAKGVSAVFLP